jgi:hypothetical protein
MRPIIFAALLLLPVAHAAAAPVQDDRAAAVAMLDKAVSALGGEERLAKHTALVMTKKGKSFPGGGTESLDFTTVISCQFPDKIRVDITRSNDKEKTTSLFVGDGVHGWHRVGGKTSELSEQQRTGEGMDPHKAWLARELLRYKGMDYTLNTLTDKLVNDHEACGLRIAQGDKDHILLYFDIKTGLPLKRINEPADPHVKAPLFEINYSDYHDAGGFKYPGKITSLIDGKLGEEFEIVEFKPLEKIDSKVFEKPD